ncbi:MAG: Ig domain-containing protein, partial [Acidobacteriota bacterium]
TGTTFAAVRFLRIDGRGDVFVWALLPGGSVPALVKLSGQDGSVLWGPIPYPGDSNAFPYPLAAVVARGGDVVATYSERTNNPVTHSTLTVRIDGGTGAVLWGPVVLATGGVSGDLLLDTGDSILLAVTTMNPQNSNLVTGPEVVFLSGATGATIRGPLDLPPGARSARAVKVAVDGNGDVVTLGVLNRGGTFFSVLVKYRGTTGAILWGPVEVPSDAWGAPVDLKLAANGDPIWVGTGESPAIGTGGVVLSRFSAATGAVVWGPRVFTQAYAVALALDGNGDVFALGDSVLLKCDGQTGGLLWGPIAVNNVYASTMRVGLSGDVMIAGWYAGVSTVARHSGSTGALVWGPVPVAASYPQAMAIDASGDILLAGSGLVMKLRGVDGSTAWGPVTLVDLTGGFSSSAALALDQAGNPIAEVFTYDGVTARRAAVFAKYDNASGSQLWGPVTWDASEGRAPQDVLLAVDSSGDVVLAANGLDDDYMNMAVRKYSGADGAPVWGPVTFDGPGTNVLTSMALVGKDPVLAGTSMGSMRTVRFGFAFSLETQTWQLPPALCGQAFQFAFLVRNAVAPAVFSVTGGALPPGLALDPTTGVLAGMAGPAGTYSFRLRVGSGTASISRDYTMVVVEGQPVIDVETSDPTLCVGDSAVLSVRGAFAAYLWLPGGETTPTITVSPVATASYTFVGTNSGGCVRTGSRTITVLPEPVQPSIAAPAVVAALAGNLVATVADHPGSRYVWAIAGGAIVSGQGTYGIRFEAGVGGVLTLTVVETNGAGCRAPAASLTTRVTPAATLFFSTSPCRIYDSRVSNVPIAAGEVRRLTLTSSCGLPSTARAVALNVTAVGVSGAGSLSVSPGGITATAAAGPAWKGDQIRAASTIVGMDATGAVDVSCESVTGSANFVIDVSGYFQ